jgi:hypothetical protein
MNVLNLAQGLLTGAVPSLLSAVGAGSASTSPASGTSAGAGSLITTRDGAMTDLLDASPAVNLLGQAAAALQTEASSSDSSQEPLLNLPPLAPMPAPKPAAAVPTDDHGQSNIVFSSPDADGAFVH